MGVIMSSCEMKDSVTNEVKALVEYKQMLKSHNCFAVNMVLVNCTNTPYSLLSLFIRGKNEIYHTCRVIEGRYMKNVTDWNNTTISVYNRLHLKTDLDSFFFNCVPDELISLKPFNPHAYLLPNQAEYGWLVFMGKPDDLGLQYIGAKITGNNNPIFYGFEN